MSESLRFAVGWEAQSLAILASSSSSPLTVHPSLEVAVSHSRENISKMRRNKGHEELIFLTWEAGLPSSPMLLMHIKAMLNAYLTDGHSQIIHKDVSGGISV